ncbi:MAG: nucleotidyltransferase family protein [Pseudomonadota bacterium]
MSLPDFEQQLLLTLIISQSLHFFWLEALRTLPEMPLSSTWRKQLKDLCFKHTTHYLAQKKTLFELDMLFEKERIPYAIFKGAHIREVIYANPACRSSADIDILVTPNQKTSAIRTLCASGYTLSATLANVSHEVTLVKDNVHVDLHWHIMRLGRTRIDLTDLYLQSRQRCNFFWSLDNDMTLIVLLTHPVFTEYSAGPQSSAKLADLRRWITTQAIDWQRVLCLLEESGMKTAAWITATLLADLTGCHLPTHIYKAISPKNPKHFLLQQWLSLNLSSKFAAYPIFPKYIFTLLAHDNLSDIFRFIRMFRAERQKDVAAMEHVQQAAQGN